MALMLMSKESLAAKQQHDAEISNKPLAELLRDIQQDIKRTELKLLKADLSQKTNLKQVQKCLSSKENELPSRLTSVILDTCKISRMPREVALLANVTSAHLL